LTLSAYKINFYFCRALYSFSVAGILSHEYLREKVFDNFKGNVENMSKCIIEKKVLPADIEEMSNLSDLALKKLDIPETARQELMMALDEAITNIVLHGYSGKKGNVKIIIDRVNDCVTVELIDSGVKFDPTRYPELDVNVPIEERKAGGMGVELVRKFTDETRYYHRDGANHFILIKKTGGENA